MAIEVSNSLTVGKTNTPLDDRTRIATLTDMESVQNPFLGMIIFCVDNGKHYKVTGLKDKQIGALTVPNAQVDTYSVTGAGKWDDLEEKPETFPPASHAHNWDGIENKPDDFPPAEHAHGWSEIENKPDSYPDSEARTAIGEIQADINNATSGCIKLSPKAIAAGIDNISGGYPARIVDADDVAGTVSLVSIDDDPLDPAKYTVGATVYMAHNPIMNDPSSFEITNVQTVYEDDGVTVAGVVLTVTIPDGFAMPTIDEELPAVAIVNDDDCDTTSQAEGQANIVTGESAGSNGSYNLIAGLGSHAFGVGNSLMGTFLMATGSSNMLDGESIRVDGTANKGKGKFITIAGNSNNLDGQGLSAFGDMINIDGIDGMAIGRNITMSDCNLSIAIGTQLNVTAKSSLTVGYQLTNDADHSMLIGSYGELADSPENKGAFVVSGGDTGDPKEIFSVRSRKKVENPLYNPTLDPEGTGTDSDGEAQYLAEPAARSDYAGQLKPQTQTVTLTEDTTVTLDADQHSRVMLAGTGTATLALKADAWQDGDKCELVFDTNSVTPVIPAAWSMPDIDLTTDPQLYVLEIAQVGTSIFVAVKYPDISDGNNATIEVGTVTTGAAGSSASVSNSGTESEVVLDFNIPKGDTGDQGDTGEKGDTGDTGNTGETGDSAYQVWLDAGNTGSEADFLLDIKGDKGDKGDQGIQGIQGEKYISSDRYAKGNIFGAVSIDYTNGDYQVCTTTADVSGITISNLPANAGMILDISNSGGHSVTVNSTEIIVATDTGRYACAFYNENGTIHFMGKGRMY